jgi:hypothetical protein
LLEKIVMANTIGIMASITDIINITGTTDINTDTLPTIITPIVLIPIILPILTTTPILPATITTILLASITAVPVLVSLLEFKVKKGNYINIRLPSAREGWGSQNPSRWVFLTKMLES